MQLYSRCFLVIVLSSSLFNYSYAEEPAVNLDKIEVTGTHIKRIDTEGPSPVTIITRDEIERSGVSSVSE